jgi:hypothetical protein
MYVYYKCAYITAADTREEVIAAENMAAKSVPMYSPRIRILGGETRFKPLYIHILGGHIRI